MQKLNVLINMKELLKIIISQTLRRIILLFGMVKDECKRFIYYILQKKMHIVTSGKKNNINKGSDGLGSNNFRVMIDNKKAFDIDTEIDKEPNVFLRQFLGYEEKEIKLEVIEAGGLKGLCSTINYNELNIKVLPTHVANKMAYKDIIRIESINPSLYMMEGSMKDIKYDKVIDVYLCISMNSKKEYIPFECELVKKIEINEKGNMINYAIILKTYKNKQAIYSGSVCFGANLVYIVTTAMSSYKLNHIYLVAIAIYRTNKILSVQI